MKKLSLAYAIALASIAGSTYALEAQVVPVTASVLGVCKFVGTIWTVSFGPIDPSTTGVKTAPLAFTYRCTKGTSPTSITASAITPMVGALASPDSIPFTVGAFAAGVLGVGFAAGAPSSGGATLSIAQAAYQDVKADSYTGSVTVTINP